jgi:hypothetical protein
MFKGNKFQTVIFGCNCLLLYLFVGFCSTILADIHQSFQLSYQSDNGKMIPLRHMAYTVKENLSK